MHTSVRSDYLHCSGTTSLTSRTAVYGPVRTVVWQGSAGDCRPYADQTHFPSAITPERAAILNLCIIAESLVDGEHFIWTRSRLSGQVALGSTAANALIQPNSELGRGL
jgi:hypothetical protein